MKRFFKKEEGKGILKLLVLMEKKVRSFEQPEASLQKGGVLRWVEKAKAWGGDGGKRRALNGNSFFLALAFCPSFIEH